MPRVKPKVKPSTPQYGLRSTAEIEIELKLKTLQLKVLVPTKQQLTNMVFKMLKSIFFLQWVGSIDLNANDQADANILVKNEAGWIDQVNYWF